MMMVGVGVIVEVKVMVINDGGGDSGGGDHSISLYSNTTS